jgi:hypothetical protein
MNDSATSSSHLTDYSGETGGETSHCFAGSESRMSHARLRLRVGTAAIGGGDTSRFNNQGELTMRAILVATLLAASLGLAGTSGAFAAPANGLSIGEAAANATMIDQVQRCRCIERRWNGSCKLRICRDRW